MTGESAALEPALAVRFADWAGRTGLGYRLPLVLAFLSLGAALVTYAALTGSLPFAADPQTVLVLLNVDLVLFLVLAATVARRLVSVWMARKRRSVGARLHTRLAVWFGLIALVPAIVVSVSSAVFFSIGVQGWFSDRVRTALEESEIVAKAYLREHRQAIRGDLLAMARDVNRAAPAMWSDPAAFSRLIATQGLLRGLSEAYVFDGSGRILAGWKPSFVLDRDPLPLRALDRARDGAPVVFAAGSEDRMRAIVKLDGGPDAFLHVGRFVEPLVLDHIARTEEAVAQYRSLEGQRTTFEITFATMFVLVALLLLMAAVGVGLTFAARLSGPITALASAAERVRGGDLATRLAQVDGDDEIASLTAAFNRMTEQLEAQRGELLDANGQLDARRHFIETVLAGVSAGVVGLDAEGRINLANRSASQLLSLDLTRRTGSRFDRAAPELAALLARARGKADRVEEVAQLDRGGVRRTLLARVVVDRDGRSVRGFVVTLDDITELQAAQRKAAWSDVARRVAHEIKNPLTPIRLAAERIRSRLSKGTETGPEAFESYTETILRHVETIDGMVNEFSEFARMPGPVVAMSDLAEICVSTLTLQRAAYPSIAFAARLPEGPVLVPCDARLVGRALTNLLKNAIEAIDGREAGAGAPLAPGRVEVALAEDGGNVVLSVRDNGRGLPAEGRERLTEPYVTTREGGTGLGLAIVKKIMEDHGGGLRIGEAPGGGAEIALIFPREDRVPAASGPRIEDG